MRVIDHIRKSKTIVNAYAFFSFYKSYLLKDHHKAEMKSLFRQVRPYTMVSYERLRNTYELAHTAEMNSIEGAFVECGVWKGGCAAIMAYVSKLYGSKREIHLFDSFEGLPDPTEEDGQKALLFMNKIQKGKYSPIYKCDAPLETVKELFFHKLNISEAVVYFHKGWFEDTIPLQKTQMEKIAILRLDGDWYESTKVCLDHLYDKVVDGGFVILDDYGYWEGCKQAVDEFLAERNIRPKLQKIDLCGYYFVKTS